MNYTNWTIENAKVMANTRGYVLLGTAWLGVKSKYDFISPKGFKWSSTWDNFIRGTRCPDDARIAFFKDIIKPYFVKHGCVVLLDDIEYKGQFQKFIFKCSLSNYHETCWNNISSNNKNILNLCICNKRLSRYIEAKNILKSVGCQILIPSIRMPGVDDKFRSKCNNGHIFYPTLTGLRGKHFCIACFKANRSKNKIVKNNIALYDTYASRLPEKCKYIITNDIKILLVECKECGSFFQPGRRCVQERVASIDDKVRGNNYFFCSKDCKNSSIFFNSYHNGGSKFEQSISKYVKSFYNSTVERNNRSIIINPLTNRSLELDLYFPKLNKAIECNGSYWHSKSAVIKRDKIKAKLCLSKNLPLLIVDELNWYYNKEQQKLKIKEFILE